MKHAKHTPGPWEVFITRKGKPQIVQSPAGGYVVTEESGWRIADVRMRTIDNGETDTANAHIIAAAPSMYDKLEVCLERLREKSDNSNRDLGLIQSIEKLLEVARGNA